MPWSLDISKWCDKALQRANKNCCDIVEFVATENIRLTLNINKGGYSKGHIANNWRVSAGGPDLTVDPTGDITGNASYARARAFRLSKPFLGKDDKVFITNSVNYSYRADKIGWPAGQGTNGWKWSGRVTAYGFTGIAINNMKGRYT